MAKFKVGDKVELLANPYAGIGNVVEVTPVGTIKAVFPERSGDTVSVFLERDLRLANSCRSTNAVVAKALNACGTARNAGDRDMYEDAIRQAIVKCEEAIKYEPDADDYSDVTRLVKQAKDILAKAYRAI